jgi:hypothetical protein
MNDATTTDRQDLKAPWWQTAACPDWCTWPHEDRDDPAERKHYGATYRLEPMLLVPAVRTDTPEALVVEPSCLDVHLEQPVREAEPYLQFSLNEKRALTLTTGEAVWLRDRLTELIEAAAIAFVRENDGG